MRTQNSPHITCLTCKSGYMQPPHMNRMHPFYTLSLTPPLSLSLNGTATRYTCKYGIHT